MDCSRLQKLLMVLALTCAPSIAAAQSGDTPDAAKSAAKTAPTGPSDVLSAVPADAWGAVCVPNIGKFDQRIMAFARPMNLPMMMGPPVQMAKMMMGLAAGFDDNGGVAIVFLPTQNPAEYGKDMVVLLPTTDFNALLTNMTPEPADGGITKVMFMDNESYAVPFGKFAAFAQSPDALKKIRASGKPLRSVLTEHQIKRFDADDLTIWVNAEEVTATDMYKGMAMMLEAMSPGSNLKALEDFRQGQISFRFDPTGLGIGVYTDAKPGTDMAKALSSTTATSDSLLAGLPREDFIFAGGGLLGSDAVEYQSKMMGESLQGALKSLGDQAARFENLVPALVRSFTKIRRVAASVTALPEGATGMVGMTAVITVDGDAKGYCSDLAKIVEGLKKGLAAGDDQNAAKFAGMMVYEPGAEKIESATVDHLLVTLPTDKIDEQTQDQIKTVLGELAVRIRIAPVDDKHVAIAFGGGTTRMADVVKAARSGDAPLASDAGVMNLRKHLPKKRSQEGYLAVERLANLASKIAAATGNSFPVTMPDVNAPAAMMTYPVAGAASQVDIYLPMEMMIAVKNAAMNAMAQGMAAPHGAPEM
jgi:hypothetical protein